MPNVLIKKINDFIHEALTTVGVPKEQAEIIADTIVYAHTHGKETHGITRLPIYIKKIKRGLMTPNTILKKTQNTEVIATIDAGDGFGQVAAYDGMSLCMKMAEKYGIGACGIRNSNNFGVAGYFTEMAVKEEMIGFIASASAPAIAPTGGNIPIFGTNPISIGFPTKGTEAPIIFDMATSEVARGKIRLAEKNGEKIPFGWALNQEGNPTNDPHEALLGTMIPIGGYKGYGIAMTIDILAGLLTGNLFAGNIKNLNHSTELSKHGHILMAIDIKKLMDYREYLCKIDHLICEIRKCGPVGAINIPGERSAKAAEQNKEFIQIGDKAVTEITKLKKELHLDTNLFDI
ncbi:MAG: Ldh family oxidoreductase [Faecalicatena sp.]|uniref:Ldh family oxidoreductase n=1 Tax=Faecalicatena sp. TaxID=2005360 RepID=UPI0025856EDA|nr:Ldh family oxidoreductase [Faecalicatena sp.]MCI6465355.1 Ldh family oxidoreductase [Faecalicatena sp.]MDY4669446.1 Ldh family oxidoreductase [Oliverpabstia sp.]MDY5617483.1 Ldh family oxidoreductase [Lachnospiraceae bacterium]